MNHSFLLINADTDSKTIGNHDNSPISSEERINLLNEINSLFPELIKFDDDGYYKKMVVLKAKNYIMDDGEKIKYKGSAFKDQKKEPALRELMNDIIQCLLKDTYTNDELVAIYHKYVDEVFNIKDIKRWSSKKSISKAVLEGQGLAQQKIRDAVAHMTLQEGDKVYIYPVIDGIIDVKSKGKIVTNSKGVVKTKPNQVYRTIDKWDGQVDTQHLLHRIYDTICILKNVLDMSLFLDYSKKALFKRLVENGIK